MNGSDLVKDWPRIGQVLSKGFYKLPISFLYPLYMLCLFFTDYGFLSIMLFPPQAVIAGPVGSMAVYREKGH